MWIWIGVGIWWLLGWLGYFLMRQGFFVSFEYALGKQRAWNGADKIMGWLGTCIGPIFVIIAVLVKGKNCFRKRNKKGKEDE